MFCKMRLSEQIHTVYCVYHWWYTGTISKSKSLHWYRCKVQQSGAVGAWFVQCTHENFAEQAKKFWASDPGGAGSHGAVWNVPARGSKPSESVVATGRRRRRVSQHFSGVELWSFEWRLPRTEEKCGGGLLMEGQRIFFCFCISGFCQILKDINVGI